MKSFTLIPLLMMAVLSFGSAKYKVVSVAGSITVNHRSALKGQQIESADTLCISGRNSTLLIERLPNGNPIEISVEDMEDGCPTLLSKAIDNSRVRHDKRTPTAVTPKGHLDVSASISVINTNGDNITASLASASAPVLCRFRIVNDSNMDLYFLIGWYDSYGFRYIDEGKEIRIKAGQSYVINALKEISGVMKGEVIMLYAAQDNSSKEQFRIVDYALL